MRSSRRRNLEHVKVLSFSFTTVLCQDSQTLEKHSCMRVLGYATFRDGDVYCSVVLRRAIGEVWSSSVLGDGRLDRLERFFIFLRKAHQEIVNIRDSRCVRDGVV